MQKKRPNDFIRYTSMAGQMMATVLILTFGGVYLDRQFPMNFALFTLLGALLGSGLSIYIVIRELSK